ncbi:hypothetical protein [Cupriavidus sp. 8B]
MQQRDVGAPQVVLVVAGEQSDPESKRQLCDQAVWCIGLVGGTELAPPDRKLRSLLHAQQARFVIPLGVSKVRPECLMHVVPQPNLKDVQSGVQPL